MAQDERRSSAVAWWDPTGRRFSQPRRRRLPSKRSRGFRDGLKGRFEFPPVTRSAPVSRHLMADLLSESLSQQELEIVLLLTNELVTNAIVHARSNFELTVRELAGCVEVEVADSDPRTPTLRTAVPEAGWGRGLTIVETMAQDWGVTTYERGKAVWFRFAPRSAAMLAR